MFLTIRAGIEDALFALGLLRPNAESTEGWVNNHFFIKYTHNTFLKCLAIFFKIFISLIILGFPFTF